MTHTFAALVVANAGFVLPRQQAWIVARVFGRDPLVPVVLVQRAVAQPRGELQGCSARGSRGQSAPQRREGGSLAALGP
ncbi:MAG TPA: hypothetical protein PKE00_00080 [Planctomycetota bacterium]|nr:hypothetical protein [Planctomycetota bacterium]